MLLLKEDVLESVFEDILDNEYYLYDIYLEIYRFAYFSFY